MFVKTLLLINLVINYSCFFLLVLLTAYVFWGLRINIEYWSGFRYFILLLASVCRLIVITIEYKN